MPKKLAVYLLMLAVGFTCLILAITLELPDPVMWLLLAVAVILNLTSAIAAMRIGLREMRPDTRKQ